MTILGLDPGSQIIILQALATYAGIASSFFFARPVLLGQTLQSNRDLLSSVRTQDKDVQELLASASDVLNEASQKKQSTAISDNKRGFALLVASLLLFTLAVAIQIGQATAEQTG